MTRARDLANLIGSGNFTTETLTATAGQTAFTPSNTFTSNFLQVFYNGLLLDPTVDYTENGTTITLTVAATAGDEMEVVTYNTFSVGDAITQTEADVRYVNASGDTMTGALVLDKQTATSQGAVLNSIKFANSYGNPAYIASIDAYKGYYDNNIGFKFNTQVGGGGGSAVSLEAMAIDASGRVTMPYQPRVSGKQTNGSGWYQNSSGFVIPLNDCPINDGGHYNATTGVFTAPVSGRYRVAATALAGNGPDYATLTTCRNGVAVGGQGHLNYNGTANGWHNMTVDNIIYAYANDTLTINGSTFGNCFIYTQGGYTHGIIELIG